MIRVGLQSVALMRVTVQIPTTFKTVHSMLLVVFPRLGLVNITGVGIQLVLLRPKRPILARFSHLILLAYLVIR